MQTRILSALVRNRFTTVLLAVIAVFLLTGFQSTLELKCTPENEAACNDYCQDSNAIFAPIVFVKVTESDGKLPIARATVDLLTTPTQTSTTSIQGLVSYPYAAPGVYNFHASKEGHLPANGSVVVPEGALGLTTFEVVIPLIRTGTISGTVKDSKTGAPIIGATVTLDGAAPVTPATATSGAGGAYHFDNVPYDAFLVLKASAPPQYGLSTMNAELTDLNDGGIVNFLLSPPVAPSPFPPASVLLTLFDARTASKVPPTVVNSITLGDKPLSLNTTTGNWSITVPTPFTNQSLTINATGYAPLVRPISGDTSGSPINLSLPESATFPATPDTTKCESAANSYRITLDWQRNGAQPEDLDLLLVIPPSSGRNATCFLDNDRPGNLCLYPNSALQLENTHAKNMSVPGTFISPPPTFETVEIAKLNPGQYQVVVHDFSGDVDHKNGSLGPKLLGDPNTRATVTIYGPNIPNGSITATAPAPGLAGYYYWVPFLIDGPTGKITLVNQTYISNPQFPVECPPF